MIADPVAVTVSLVEDRPTDIPRLPKSGGTRKQSGQDDTFHG
jgi:hypothetical protein